MSLKQLVDRMVFALSTHALTAAGLSRVGHNDRAVVTESIVIPLLQKMYEWPALRNANVDNPQTRGYDLIDEDAGIAVQVTTAAEERKKVRDSLIGFAVSRPEPCFEHLYVLFLRAARISRQDLADIVAPAGLYFDPSTHIIEISDFAARAFNVDINELVILVRNLERAVGLIPNLPYEGDPIAISNDLVITLRWASEPPIGEGFRRESWQGAARLLEEYQLASRVARLQGNARAASDVFLRQAELAIETARVFTMTGCTNADHHHEARKAWRALKAVQLDLLEFDQEAPFIAIN